MGTDVVKNVNKNNASHAVLFEALALVSFFTYILIVNCGDSSMFLLVTFRLATDVYEKFMRTFNGDIRKTIWTMSV